MSLEWLLISLHKVPYRTGHTVVEFSTQKCHRDNFFGLQYKALNYQGSTHQASTEVSPTPNLSPRSVYSQICNEQLHVITPHGRRLSRLAFKGVANFISLTPCMHSPSRDTGFDIPDMTHWCAHTRWLFRYIILRELAVNLNLWSHPPLARLHNSYLWFSEL